jgi:WS/DGAT/MGAT family acyltransferase
MPRLSPLDLSFLAIESSARPMHSGAVMLFEPPDGDRLVDVVSDTVAAFRRAEPVPPWNQVAVVGVGSLPHWETAPEVDMAYHVRRIGLPAPGSMSQLMELVSHLYPAPLDRSRPLWESYVVEGLEDDRMALFLKGHHAAADGASALRILLSALSDAPTEEPRAPWTVAAKPAVVERRNGRLPVVGSAVSSMAGLTRTATELTRLPPAMFRLMRNGMALPFSGAPTQTMSERISTARSFATLELPLDEVRQIAKRYGGTVNDVLLSVCDDAMQRYRAAVGGPQRGRMVCGIPISTRPAEDESAGNDVVAMLVALGDVRAAPDERLAQVVRQTQRVKAQIQRTSPLPLRVGTMSLLAFLELRENLPIGRSLIPNVANFILSNLPAGPPEAKFLGRSRLAGMYVAPIVPPALAVNFTVMSYHGALCVGIAAARNIIPDTPELSRLAAASFDDLKASPSPV